MSLIEVCGLSCDFFVWKWMVFECICMQIVFVFIDFDVIEGLFVGIIGEFGLGKLILV